MFSDLLQDNSEDEFCNVANTKNVECIIPSSELVLTIRTGGVPVKKPCIVCAEKIEYKGQIQLRITEQSDNRKMYICTVDSNSFHELKQDQSLHVTFSGFIDNLVNMVRDCQRGVLDIGLTQYRDGQLVLQFFERRPFKNLIHLCLPAKIAPLGVVIYYMSKVLNSLQKKTESQEYSMQSMRDELDTHLFRVSQLEAENTKLRESLLENNRAAAIRQRDEVAQVQEALKRASEQRQMENERHMKAVTSLQGQLDKMTQEKSILISEKGQETKKVENLRAEVATLKGTISALQEKNENLLADIATAKTLERKNEMYLAESHTRFNDLHEKLKKLDKIKSELMAELEAEKNICTTKRQALEMATEEIAKANEIISKQGQELAKLRKTIGWRTEIALQQEKAIKEMNKQLTKRCHQVSALEQTIEGLRKDIPGQLETMKNYANVIEAKYSEQIIALNQKLTSMEKDHRGSGMRTIR